MGGERRLRLQPGARFELYLMLGRALWTEYFFLFYHCLRAAYSRLRQCMHRGSGKRKGYRIRLLTPLAVWIKKIAIIFGFRNRASEKQ